MSYCQLIFVYNDNNVAEVTAFVCTPYLSAIEQINA